MAKPLRYPRWATLSDTGTVEGLPNKQEPTTQWKDYGQPEYGKVPRQYLNDTLALNNEWLEYLDEQVDDLLSFSSDVGKTNVISAVSATLTKDTSNNYYYLSGSAVTLANVVSVGGGIEQIGSTVKVRTSNITTISLDAGATLVGFTASIPANRTATFTIEDIPSGTGTQWSCSLSAGV